MERARLLFIHGGYTVLETANAVGYANPSHLTRVFRETFGRNPSESARITVRHIQGSINQGGVYWMFTQFCPKRRISYWHLL